MLIRLLICIFLGSGLAACRQLQDASRLSREISAALNEPEVKVQLDTHQSLTVTLTNSPVADRPETEWNAHCRRVAEFVRDHYVDYAKLQRIQVVFGTQWRWDAEVTSSSMFCMFTPRELRQSLTPGRMPDDAS